MSSLNKRLTINAVEAVHFVVTYALFVGGWVLLYRNLAMHQAFMINSVLTCVLYPLFLYLFSRLYDAYQLGICRAGEVLYSQVLANLISLAFTYLVVCILARQVVNILPGFAIAAVQTVFSVLWVLPANQLYFKVYPPKHTMVIYRNQADLDKIASLQYLESHWCIDERVMVTELPTDEAEADTANVLDLYRWLEPMMEKYENIVVSGISATLRNGIEKYCIEQGKECYFVPHTGDIIAMGSEHMRNFALPICRVTRAEPRLGYLFWKRCLDLLVSLLGLAIFSPLMLLIALGVKLQDGGTVFYRQARLTKDGKVFHILKFRSMRMDAEKDGKARLAREGDTRITPLGKVIRAIRMDELPQLFNILRGDMSLVGPRPERPEIAADYQKTLPAFALRLQVKAGLTGYAQIYGRYNTQPQDKLKLDLMYINRMNMFEDLKMLFATVKILFMKESTQGVEGEKGA